MKKLAVFLLSATLMSGCSRQNVPTTSIPAVSSAPVTKVSEASEPADATFGHSPSKLEPSQSESALSEPPENTTINADINSLIEQIAAKIEIRGMTKYKRVKAAFDYMIESGLDGYGRRTKAETRKNEVNHMKRILPLLMAGMLTLSACGSTDTAHSASVAEAPVQEVSSQTAAVLTPEPEPVPEPEADNSWQFDAPENHGMDPAVFARMHETLSGAPVYAVVTAKDGVIIDEYYQDGSDEASVFPLHSASKSFTGALIGIAIEQGLIGGVDDLLSNYLPQVAELSDGKQNLTLRHLLTHTSGLEWYEWGSGYSNWEEFQSAENWVDYILGRNQVAQPGTVFNYSTGNTHLLSAVLQQATGMTGLEYAQQNLFEPLGMESVQWHADPQGVTDGGNGISMTARDAARFGQLFLQGGNWNSKQLVPANWVEESTAAQNNGAWDSTGSYGFQWWTRAFGNYETYYAFGAWGQYILVVPELNLVTVIASPGPQNSYTSRVYFTDYVLAAVQEEA